MRRQGSLLDQDRADDETDRHTGKAEEEHDVGDAIDGVKRGKPIERRPTRSLHQAFSFA